MNVEKIFGLLNEVEDAIAAYVGAGPECVLSAIRLDKHGVGVEVENHRGILVASRHLSFDELGEILA